MHGINSMGTYVPDTSISLFSISRASIAGHTIIHHGPPDTGMHGMFINGTDDFVPFVWDPETRLWWIQLFSGVKSNWKDE
jgi:hypothetical protein